MQPIKNRPVQQLRRFDGVVYAFIETEKTLAPRHDRFARILSGIAAIADDYDVVLSDIWGVVHNGQQHFVEAVDALSRFRARGATVVLITNAPRPSPPVLKQLDGLQVPRDCFDAVVTSGDVTLAFIAAHGAARLHHIGPPRDLSLFEILARDTGLRPPLTPVSDATYVVCTGLFDDDDELSAYEPTFAVMRERGMEMICANPDIVVHVGDKELWCSGALAQRYEAMGGKVLQAGKPFAPIYDRALDLAAKQRGRPIDRARVLAIGDGLGTDIGGAAAQGLDAVFVTSGIHREALHGAQMNPRVGAPDAEVLARLLASHKAAPLASMSALVW